MINRNKIVPVFSNRKTANKVCQENMLYCLPLVMLGVCQRRPSSPTCLRIIYRHEKLLVICDANGLILHTDGFLSFPDLGGRLNNPYKSHLKYHIISTKAFIHNGTCKEERVIIIIIIPAHLEHPRTASTVSFKLRMKEKENDVNERQVICFCWGIKDHQPISIFFFLFFF